MRIRFEMGECGRCGGSGRFSHNGEHDRCYGCNGSGEALTSRGKRAQSAYDALMKERLTRYVDELNVDDVIHLPRGHNRKAGWYRISAITIRENSFPEFEFRNGPSLGYGYRAEVLVRDLDVIREIAEEVATRFKGAILVED